jgi:transposase-like protein
VLWLAKARVWKCREKHESPKFSAKTGTVMEDSPLPLQKWLPAIWLLVNCKNGISSYELHRALGVTQKTAWFMLHRIRKALNISDSVSLGGPDGGVVEVDETFIGGAARMMNAKQRRKAMVGGKGLFGPHSYTNKATVMAMVERDGQVVAKVVPDRTRQSLAPNIIGHVAKGSTVHTDEHRAYEALGTPFTGMDYEHQVIDHSVAYVDGQIHTNNVENFWSLLKRGIRGTYISVEPFHLFRYLDEQVYRFNQRKMTDRGRFIEAVRQIVGKRLTYKELIGQTAMAPAV